MTHSPNNDIKKKITQLKNTLAKEKKVHHTLSKELSQIEKWEKSVSEQNDKEQITAIKKTIGNI